ncbi:MAG: elongation factor P, partial [Defluviitaleaceae bacterium]|nr:elongation factor P [Defluviitaleaceae bacterium]
MVQAGDFKNGLTVQIENDIFVVLEFQHVKPGKGPAFVRSKIKNLKSGSIVERTFRPEEKFPNAHIERKNMQYLYRDEDTFHFMDNETYDQIELNLKDVGNSLKFVKENETVKMLSHNEKVFAIEPPQNVDLEVTETEPGIKGNTASGGGTKPAIVETGATVLVPLF